jgi:hypothetical protein
MPTDLQFQLSNNDSDMPRKTTKKKERGLDLMAGWVGFVDSNRGGGGSRAEWDIPNRRYRFFLLDKGRAQMNIVTSLPRYEILSIPTKKTTPNPTNLPPLIPHPLKSTVFPPLQKPPTKTKHPYHPHKESNLPNQKLPKKIKFS